VPHKRIGALEVVVKEHRSASTAHSRPPSLPLGIESICDICVVCVICG
jgi:hypothetical protein